MGRSFADADRAGSAQSQHPLSDHFDSAARRRDSRLRASSIPLFAHHILALSLTLADALGRCCSLQAEVDLNIDIEQSLRDLVTAVGGGPLVTAARNLLIGTLDLAQLLDLQLGETRSPDEA